MYFRYACTLYVVNDYRDPNKPVALPNGAPAWPTFDTVSSKFIELNSVSTKVIATPHKERLEKIVNLLFQARSIQTESDKSKIRIPMLLYF